MVSVIAFDQEELQAIVLLGLCASGVLLLSPHLQSFHCYCLGRAAHPVNGTLRPPKKRKKKKQKDHLVQLVSFPTSSFMCISVYASAQRHNNVRNYQSYLPAMA